MGLFKFIVDRWGALNYKRAYADAAYRQPNREVFPAAMRSWVPPEDHRRLAAYTLYAAYGHNQAWEIAAIQDGADASERREFGDPAMLLNALVSHLLGSEQTITVPGAEDADPADGTTPAPQATHAAAVQERLRTWASEELFSLRLQQNERKTVREGDGVYLLGWDAAKQRPRLSVVDPGFYFPDLPDNAGDSADYPERIHFAWEIDADPRNPDSKARLRRITYELGPIGTATVSDTAGERPARAPAFAADGTTPLMTRGDTWNPEAGTISRHYPWNEQPTTLTCYLTDAEWLLDDIKADQDVQSLDYRYATFQTNAAGEVLDHLDLQLDFIPVIHTPNSIPEDGHWGESSFAQLMQLFDEIQGTDTDSSQASATTGSPILGIVNPGNKGVRGRAGEDLRVAPGMAIELSEGGNLITVDTSRMLAELRNKSEELQGRLSVNSRMPAVALGTLDPTKAPSGFSIALSYGPMDPLIDSMHLARDHKYQLLFKMVQRLFMAGRHPDWTGPVIDARLAWGSYKPTDKAATLEMVRGAVKDGVMSLETGIRLLDEAGFPIDDIGAEIENIQKRQFAAAKDLADATGDTSAVGDFLGIEVDPDPAPPALDLPGLPAGEDADQPEGETAGDKEEGLGQGRGNV